MKPPSTPVRQAPTTLPAGAGTLDKEPSVGPDETLPHPPATSPAALGRASHSVVRPAEQRVPMVFASPHSGDDYPPAFIRAARLSPMQLRRSEDAFVDRLFEAATSVGAPLLKAHFPRVYVDPNREPYELDPAMFDAPLPDFVNVASPRVAAGLGTIAKVVATGENIYARRLSFEEARQRIEAHYVPYHRTLQALLAETEARFGCYLLVDCHSMPSIGGPMDADPGTRRLDFVLGDCFGTACASGIIAVAERSLSARGYTVERNIPYAGGFTTRHYGQPGRRRHALQIEVNRGLYMDERQIQPSAGLPRVTADITRLIEALAAAVPALIGAR
jgi:N-formylglutamate amidohydrolase